jgi:hypothetical protein
MTVKKPAERVQEARSGSPRGDGSGEGAGKPVARRYGVWAGDPRGDREDPARCREEVWPTGRSMIPHQCRRPRGHGPDGAYCSVHGKSSDNIKPMLVLRKYK